MLLRTTLCYSVKCVCVCVYVRGQLWIADVRPLSPTPTVGPPVGTRPSGGWAISLDWYCKGLTQYNDQWYMITPHDRKHPAGLILSLFPLSFLNLCLYHCLFQVRFLWLSKWMSVLVEGKPRLIPKIYTLFLSLTGLLLRQGYRKIAL